jgi:SWI/SNF-related matrix-associated actin-dependent regulator of chromatin subfamily A member 5
MIRQFVVTEKKKITIFSGFDQALNLCEDLLQMEKSHAHFGHVRLDGSTTNAWRKLSLFLFANDPRCKVFLLSIRAGGEGLNLVSSSTVIFIDDDWNPQIMRQAEARVHRLGQTEPVQIFRLHARGTVEDQMRHRLTKKAYLADQVMKAPPGDNRYSPMDLDSEAPGELALAPRNPVAHDALNVKELANSDLSTILICCTINEENAFEMSRAEKKEWLERAERVKTNIFNGEQIDTSSRGYSVYKETIIGVSKASRRIGKSRVVIIDDWEVSRDSVEAALKLNSPTKPKPKAALKARKINDTVSNSFSSIASL